MPLPVLRSERLSLRPIEETDLPTLSAIVRSPTVAPWWGTPGDRDDLLQDGDAFVVDAGGEVAGWLGFAEETDPGYRHVGLDIVLAQPFQDRGLGSEALRTVIRWFATERGHHRFTIDPAVANARAIRAYEAVGFKPVGVMRRYERAGDGEWRDSLLMDLLVEEIEL